MDGTEADNVLCVVPYVASLDDQQVSESAGCFPFVSCLEGEKSVRKLSLAFLLDVI